MSARPVWLTLAAMSTAGSLAWTTGALGIQTPLPQAGAGPGARDVRASVVTGTARLAGTVVTDDRRPLRRVVVTLQGAEVPDGLQALSGDDGAFGFEGLPAGRFTLMAERPGYVKTFYGSHRPGRPPGMPIALADGQSKTDLVLQVPRGVVIDGFVRAENGAPLASAQVTALEPEGASGERKLVRAPGPLPQTTTDDRGFYRIYGLPPGEFTVMAVGGGGIVGGAAVRETTSHDVDVALRALQGGSAGPITARADPGSKAPVLIRPTVYLPGVPNGASAVTFSLVAGQERHGVDLVVPLARAATIEGLSVGPDGNPLSNVSVALVNLTTGSLYTSPGILRPDSQGRWAMPNLPPAQYEFVGQAPGSNGPPLWAVTDVVLSGEDVSGVVLSFQPALTVSGSLAFHGTAAPPEFASVALRLVPEVRIASSAFAPPPAMVAPDGIFSFSGVAPGRYRLSATTRQPWALESAVVGGRDTLDVPLEVLPNQPVEGLVASFTDRPTELSGTLFDSLGRPTPEYSIVVFPVDRALWLTSPRRLVGPVKLGSDGRYLVAGLPPGEYYVSAVTDADRSQVMDPAFLEELVPASARVTLADHERKMQDLRIGG